MVHRMCAVAIAILLLSCSSNDSTIADQKVIAYLPHVSSIEIPDRIYEGIEFEITLHLSSQALPELLSGLPSEIEEVSPYAEVCGFASNVIVESNVGNQTVYFLNPWIVSPPLVGEANSTVRYKMTIYRSGVHSLRIYSTNSEDTGGVKIERSAPYSLQSPFIIESAEYQEYTITVLPAEEAEQ